MKRGKVVRLRDTCAKALFSTSVFLTTTAAMANSIIDNGTVQNVLPGTPFDAAGYVIVGGNAYGQLNISGGGQATNTDAYIGFNPLSRGEVFVTGSGATWTTSDFLYIGFSGEAVVMVDDGARVIVQNGAMLAANGGSAQLTLSGTSAGRSVFSTPYLMMGVGTGLLQWDGGILQATGNELEFFPNFGFLDIDIGANGAFFDTDGFNVGVQTSGILVGTGGLTKLGTGTLDIAGNNSWSGDTSVLAGTLALDSYTQGGSRSLTIGVASSVNYGKLTVSGTANFNNGNLIVDVIGSPALANNSALTGVITAGTLNATSFTVTDNSALFDFAASISGNSVDLNVTTNSAGITVYSSVLNNHLYPARGAAGVLDTQIKGTPTGDMANVVTAFGALPDERSVARAAAQTLPLNSSAHATLGVLDVFNAIFAGRIGSDPDAMASDRAIWITPMGGRTVQDDTPGNASGYGAETWGLAAGMEGAIGLTQVGFAYALANTRLDGNSQLSGADRGAGINSHVIAVYGSHALDDLTLGFQADAGWTRTESARRINFGGLDRTAFGSFDSLSLHAGGSLSKAFALGEVTTFTSALRADYTWLGTGGYSERGAGALNLGVDANAIEALILGVDGRLVHALTPHLQLDAALGLSYDAINDSGALTASYEGAPGQSFAVAGLDRSPWAAKAGVGVTHSFDGGASLAIRYDARGWNGSLNQSVALKAVGRF